MGFDCGKTVRGAFAGAVAASVWLAQQPLDKPVFGVDHDDSELLGKLFTRGPAWPVIGAAAHLANGALMGAAYSNVAARMPLPPWVRGPVAALIEHVAAWPLTIAVDRLHPARVDLPRLATSGRAFAQATWRHLVFGLVLGELERRLNAPLEREVPTYEHVVSSNGHGKLEHVGSVPGDSTG